jgi:hypothetical protein
MGTRPSHPLSAGACRVQGNIAGIAFGRAAAAVETAEPAQ